VYTWIPPRKGLNWVTFDVVRLGWVKVVLPMIRGKAHGYLITGNDLTSAVEM
jgi:hypothetical protein